LVLLSRSQRREVRGRHDFGLGWEDMRAIQIASE